MAPLFYGDKMESFIKTIRLPGGKEVKKECFSDLETENVRMGWYVLKLKSYKVNDKEICPRVCVDDLPYNPGTIFQCHPKVAELMIEKEQVEVIKKPSRKKNVETS